MSKLIALIATLLAMSHFAFSQTIDQNNLQTAQTNVESADSLNRDETGKTIAGFRPRLKFSDTHRKSSDETAVEISGKNIDFKPATDFGKEKNKRQANNEFWRFELFTGYQFSRLNKGTTGDHIEDAYDINNLYDDENNNTHGAATTRGVNVQGTFNLSRYLGIKVDFSATRDKGFAHVVRTTGNTAFVGTIRNNYEIYNVLAGIQVKDNLKDGRRFKFFGHLLGGIARTSNKFNGEDLSRVFGAGIGSFDAKIYDNSFAMAMGGGLDIAVNRRIDIRVFQLDYNPVFLKDKAIARRTPLNPANPMGPDYVNLNRGVQHNYRLSFGIVIH